MAGKMRGKNQLARPHRPRNRWMTGGSALAGATALALAPAGAAAHAFPQLLPIASPIAASLPAAGGPVIPEPSSTPIITDTFVITGQSATSVISPLSSTVAPANGDTNTAGINVAASANYFAAEVDFRPGTALDEVELFTPGAIINWTTNTAGTAGGEVTFLGSGQRLNFTSALNDYTVLNRIFTPTIDAAVRIDGAVTSNTLLGSGQGGNIWFYSPGGLIIGASSIFNVGSLVLTSSNLNSIGPTMDFTGVAEANTAVIIESGAQISALGPSSYLAIVAPRVEQGGTVNVNGSVAYVGAEQAQLTINNGLFDISVGVGSADANGVVHTGTTTGAASAPIADAFGQISDADARGIYMVAVPKNTAISMLVGGVIGYQPAEGASLAANGSIILSAGTGTTAGGSIANPVGQVDLANAVSGGSVVLDGATLTSSAEIYASDTVSLAPSAASAISAGSDGRGGYDLSVTADGGIALSLAGSGAISIDGDLTLKSAGDIDVDLTAAAGTLVVGGNFLIDTQSQGADDFFTVLNNGGTGIGADAVSGAINLTIGGGTSLDVGGNLVLNSAAQGGKGELQNGLATAGDIAVDFSTTGTSDIGGLMLISAEAISAQFGKIAGNGPGGGGSDSTSGNITVNLNTGGLNAGGLFVNASAEASSGDNAAIAQSNDAVAGAITVNILGGFNQLGQIDLISRADGAASFDTSGAVAVGQVTRGSVGLTVTNLDATLAVTGDVFIDVSTDGAVTAPTTNSASITVDNAGPMGGMFVGGSLRIDTPAGGGAIAGVTTAGSVLLQAADGELSTGFLDISARASESGRNFAFGGAGQDFQGGDVTLRAGTDGLMNFGVAFIDTAAIGAVNSAGDATGGSITLEANDGAIQFQSFGSLNAGARGGSGADLIGGGTAMAQGGNIFVSLSGTAGLMDLGDVFIGAAASILFDVGSGSIDFSGDGGSAVAGNILFDLNGGRLSANSMSITSQGTGGIGGTLPPAIAPFSTGLPSAGNGGSGQGGTITFNLDGSDILVGNLNILADGIGGDGAFGSFEDGTRGGSGGDAVGGAAVFNALSGSLSTASITVAARANTVNGGGSGGFAAGSEGGNGGNATGGTATFNLDGSATISSVAVLVSTEGFGGAGGDSFAIIDAFSAILASQAAGSGGNGTGGAATFNNTSGLISFTSMTASAAGIGGNGGTSSGFSMNDSGGAGGAGGSGIGGFSTINLNQDDASGPAYTVDAGGLGGAGGGGLFSGNGGDAIGGTANLAINNSDITFNFAFITADAVGGDAGFADTAGGSAGSGGSALGGSANLDVTGAAANVSTSEPLRLSADATGGRGADGPIAAAGGNGGDGGAGGSGSGGTVRIGLTGAGAGLNLNANLVTLSADADGGQGGTGGASFAAVGGTGGLGGDATGGTLSLEANSGTTLTLDEFSGGFAMAATGTGGAGGQGGDGGAITGSNPGTGGNGGTGIGGSPTLRAIGGTITGTGTGTGADLASIGIGGNGGAAGFSGIASGAQGNGGDGQGGNPIIELLDGSPGIITLGDVSIVSAGFGGSGLTGGISLGGRIDIRDLSVDAGGNFTVNSLTADVIGDIASAGGGFFVSGGSGTNVIFGDQIIGVVGDISYAFDGDGQLVVGGATQLTATGSILITHTNNAGPVISLSSGGNFTANAGLDFLAGGQSIISSGNVIAVRAEGSAQANDLQALSFIDFSAGLNAAVNNASVIGPAVTANVGAGTIVLNGIDIRIGGNNDPSFEQYDPTHSAAITGNVTSTGFISVTAGGNAVFAAGSATVSDNGLTVRTGDDIIIASGALVEAAANPATTPDTALPFGPFNNLVMDAGALARSGELITAPLTPIASIVSSGTISANSFAVILNANAIDGLGSTINAASLAADIADAPAAGLPQSDDAGLLSANCLQGTICLGSVAATNRIEVGQNSNNDVIQLIVEQAAISANDVLITIRDDIVMGSNGIPTSINAANTFAVQSLTGDVNLLDAVIDSNQITIAAAGSVLGSGSLTSANDIGITVGQDLNALLIDTGGQLTTVAGVGGAPEAEYTVTGAINVGTYTQGGAAPLRIVAGADISFGAINLPGSQEITLIAGNTAAGDITLGSITGGTAFLQAAAGAITVTGDIALAGLLEAAAQSIFLRSTNALTVQAAASAGGIDIQTAGDLDLRGLTATGNIVLNSTGGSVVVNQAVSAANALTIGVGGIIDLQTAASGATIDILAGDINIGTAGSLGRSDLTGSIVITTLGDILLGGAGGGSTIGGVMEIDNAEFSRIFSGGDLSINAAIAASGAGGNITIDTLDVLVGAGAGQAGNIGPAGALFLDAAASINVIGAATMTNAGAGNLFSLVAGQTINVDPVNGAILVQNANGGLAGTLELAATTIQAVSDAAAGDIDGAAIADINSRLDQNDGVVNDLGYFAADNLSFSADNALLIQNSGAGTAIDERRGFTANSLTVNAANSATVIVINGTVGGLTGFDALVAAGVFGLFDPGSTINGCLILNTARCAGIPGFEDFGPRNPIQDLIDKEIDPRIDDRPGVGTEPGDDLGDDLGGILVGMRQPTSMREDPLLDDPVTGAGNEDLWVSGPDCDGVDADSEACREPVQ